MANSRSKTARPMPWRFRNLRRWEGVLGNLQTRPKLALTIVAICLGVLAFVGHELFGQYEAYSHWRQAQQQMASYDFLKAKDHLEECLKTWPNSAETNFTMARASRRAGDFETARKFLDKADKLGWVEGLVDLELQLIRAQKGELQAVEDALVRYLDAKHPEQHLILESLIKGYLHTYRLSEAVYWLGVWIERYPDDWMPRFWRGQTYERVHRRGEAIEDFREVIKRKPDHSEARIHLADLLLKNYPEEALPHYQAYREANPAEPIGLAGMARCQKALGQIEKATATLDQFFAEAKEVKNVAAYLLRAQLALDRGHASEALKWIDQAEAIDPYQIDMIHTKALALRQDGRTAEADKSLAREEELKKKQKELESATEKLISEPKNAALRCKAGSIMMQVGQEKEGFRWLKSALQEDPNHVETHAVLAEFYKKQADDAETALKKDSKSTKEQKEKQQKLVDAYRKEAKEHHERSEKE